MAYFTPGLFEFLSDLKANNDREWFKANKDRYVDEVEFPFKRFVEAAGLALRDINPAFGGGAPFRIYRDTRFSHDKSPFKTNVAAHFTHRNRREMHSLPGFYVHLAPGHNIAGGGIWRPEPPSLGKVRDRIVEEPAEWAEVKAAMPEITGESLKRPPNGYDANHPYVEDLKRKDFVAMTSFTEEEVCRDDFLDRFVEVSRGIVPLMAFLTRALELEW